MPQPNPILESNIAQIALGDYSDQTPGPPPGPISVKAVVNALPWQAFTFYVANQLVTNGGTTYIADVPHLSGASFAGTNWSVFGSGGGGGAVGGALAGTLPNPTLAGVFTARVTTGTVAAHETSILGNTAPITLTLPAAPINGTINTFDGTGLSGTTATVTVLAGAGDTLWAALTIQPGQVVSLQYSSATNAWFGSGGSPLPPSVAHVGSAVYALPPATGNAITDTANVQAGLTATAGGGDLLFNGIYHVNAQLTYYAATRWIGTARGASGIQLTADLYVSGASPALFIVPYGGETAFASGEAWIAENMTFTGPGGGSCGSGSSIAGNKTTGIRLNHQALLKHCYVSGFFVGGEMWADHCAIRDSKISSNYYNLDFSDAMTTFGNQTLDNVDLTGAWLSSVHIGGAGYWDASSAYNTHMGASPLGIFKTDTQSGWDGSGNPVYAGTPSTQGGVTGFDFSSVYFESMGNGAILDISTGAGALTLGAGVWSPCNMSWSATYLVTNAPLNNTLYQGEWSVITRNVGDECYLYGGESPMVAGSVGAWHIAGGAGPILVQDGPQTNAFGSGSTWCPSCSGSPVMQLPDGTARLYAATGTIAAGDLVEMTRTSFTVQRATGTVPVLGVARNAASGGVCLVQVDGLATLNFIGTGLVVSSDRLSLNTGTPYLADEASANPTMPVVGTATVSGSSPTVQLAGILLLLGGGVPQSLPLAGGTMAGVIAMGANKITGVANGSGAQDVAAFGQIPTASSTQTLSNKRITKRVIPVTQSATPAINTDTTDVASITGLAQAITSMSTNLTGTPQPGDTLIIEITDNGTARALAFGASFVASGTIAVPTTTVPSTLLTTGWRRVAANTAWVIAGIS